LGLKKRGLFVSLLILAVAIAAVSGVVLGSLGNTSNSKCVTVTIQGDSRVYTNDGTPIPFRWGTLSVGENTKTVTFTNHANANYRAHLTASPNLPRGWTLTFSPNNQPIPAGRTVTGTVTLTVPLNAHVGNYNWGAAIILEQTR
jgi:hypothetical protein